MISGNIQVVRKVKNNLAVGRAVKKKGISIGATHKSGN